MLSGIQATRTFPARRPDSGNPSGTPCRIDEQDPWVSIDWHPAPCLSQL